MLRAMHRNSVLVEYLELLAASLAKEILFCILVLKFDSLVEL